MLNAIPKREEEKTVINVIIPFPKREAVCKKGRNLIRETEILTQGKARKPRDILHSKITQREQTDKENNIWEKRKYPDKLRIAPPNREWIREADIHAKITIIIPWIFVKSKPSNGYNLKNKV